MQLSVNTSSVMRSSVSELGSSRARGSKKCLRARRPSLLGIMGRCNIYGVNFKCVFAVFNV